MLVAAGQVELAAEEPVDRIVVDLKRVAQAGDIAPDNAEARVDLLAAVVARIPEREQTVGVNFRTLVPHVTAADGHIAVFDDDVAGCAAPCRIPGAQVVAAEIPLDARRPERSDHFAVEAAAAAERHGAGMRSEIVHDAGEHLIALLPVAARHVEGDARSLAPRGDAIKGHDRSFGREPAVFDGDVARPAAHKSCRRPAPHQECAVLVGSDQAFLHAVQY